MSNSYAVYVRCDHVSPADVKMGRTNEVEIIAEEDEPAGFIHICNNCRAQFGDRYSNIVVM